MRYAPFACLLVGCATLGPDSEPSDRVQRRVLVVGWDGVRGDAADVASTPNLERLAADGGLSFEATTHMTGPHSSAPGWTSVLTGVRSEEHGVVANGDYELRDTSWLSFIEVARDAGMRTMAGAVWGEVVYGVIGSDVLDEVHWGGEDTVVDWTLERMDLADVFFVHHDAPDHAGHDGGFSIDNLDYLASIAESDDRLGRYLDAIASREEQWLVMVTTDHGGNLDGHGEIDADNQGIFLAGGVVGTGASWSMDAASHLDVHPTVLRFLELEPDSRGIPGVDRTL